MFRFAATLRRARLAAPAALALSFGALTPALADDKAPADTTKPVMFLKETVVTGARYPRAYYESPQALSFVNRRQIREAAPIVTSDVLAQLPGVDNSKDSPWEQRPVIRGLSGQRVLVLMDGSPMNSARGNGPHPSLVDPSQVERIEVVRGPSSVAYGSDALGGAINIITRESAGAMGDRSLRGGLTVGGSTAEKMRTVAGELSPRLGKFSAFLSGGGQKTDDYESPQRTVANSAFSSTNWLANLRYDFTERLALKTGWQQYRANDAGIPGLTTDFPGYHQDFDFSFYNRDYGHVSLEHAYPGSFWLNQALVQLYWQREYRDFFSTEILDASDFGIFGVPPAGSPGGPPAGTQTRLTNQDRYFDLNTAGFRAQMTSAKTRYARFTLGVDGAQDRTDGDNLRFRFNQDASGATLSQSFLRTASVPDGKFANLGTFLQGEWYVTPRTTVSGGARFTHYRYRTEAGVNQPGSPFTARSLNDDALSGSIGVAYQLNADLHLTANVASGYREPNAQDLFFNGPASVGFVQGNPDLKPERSLSYDAGVRWGPGPVAIAANVFYSTYDDLIDAIPNGTVNFQPAYRYTNITTATIWGGDLEAEARWRDRWTVRTQMSGQVGDATDREGIRQVFGVDTDRAPLPLIPPFKGGTSIRWNDGSHRYWVEPGARWSWRTNRLPFSQGVRQLTAFKKEYIVGDLMAGATFGGQRLTVGVRNIGDATYQPALSSVEEPGISFVGSLSTSF